MSMNAKKLLFAGACVVCVVCVIFLWNEFVGGQAPESALIPGETSGTQDAVSPGAVSGATEDAESLSLVFSPTVPQGIALSKSENEKPSDAPGGDIKSFTIRLSPSGFSVERIVVERGDRVQLNLVASQGKFDFAVAPSIGGYVVVEEGKTAALGFDAQTVGTYEFACRLFCPDGAILKGQVIIVQ
jgi:heme/copper-type cytochrome/quinol oxidase subunit 2